MRRFFDGWTDAKNGNSYDYARFFNTKIGDSKIIGAKADQVWAEFDLKATIARDYNSPSVIMWSVGNEMITGGTKPFDETAQLNLIKWTKEARPLSSCDARRQPAQGWLVELSARQPCQRWRSDRYQLRRRQQV